MKKNKDRNFAEPFVLFNALKQLAPAYFRQIPVCENEVRKRRVCCLFLKQKLHCLLAILCKCKLPADFCELFGVRASV